MPTGAPFMRHPSTVRTERLLRHDASPFDLYHGPNFEEVVSAQVSFLREVLAP